MIRKLAQVFGLMFIFTIPWENAFSFGSLGSISRLIGLGAAGLWLVSLVINKKIRNITFFHVAVLVFLLFNISSLMWSKDYDLTYIRVKTYLQMLIQIWMLWDLFASERLYKSAIRAFILGAWIAVISTLYNFVTGQAISQWESGRYSGGGQNAVELALILTLCIPLALYLAIEGSESRESIGSRILLFAFIPFAYFAIVLTASRTALIAIVPGIIYLGLSFRQFHPLLRTFGLILLITIVFIGQSFVPVATLERLSTISDSIAVGDLGGRSVLWARSWLVFLEHPLLGIGSGALASPKYLGAVAHNTFISILAELGVVGFFIFLAMLGCAVIQAIRQPKSAVYLWLTVLATWIIGVQSLTWEYSKSTWLILGMVAISAGALKVMREQPIRDDAKYRLSKLSGFTRKNEFRHIRLQDKSGL